MNTYYALRNAGEFKIIYMDPASAELWIDNGWKIRSFDSNALAQNAIAEWKGERRKGTLSLVRRQA